ncbi:amidohydrolase [Stenotrophomonas sp. CFBP8980]|jgi:predicted amidohydrolase YtcJ|uniref:amidohydrolase n=1 Tax=Stenotrophomonas sp. CFBP8980 TaxID=3096523 RepID=UPI002A69D7A0|nr:amidohydrolase [Stenotrophomonas sp. CFBP8980]MDY1034820.1 amidohydrolase [Stenotrophomonas sp. CFBP8980]
MKRLATGLSVLLLCGCAGYAPKPVSAPATMAAAQDAADVIYFGGDVVTVNDAQPTAEAVAIKDGRILAVGRLQELVARAQGAGTQLIDMTGTTMLPGFIDPHSHFLNAMTMEDQANVTAPPVGPASTAAEIVAELQRFAKAKSKAPGDLVMGYGYDENLLPGDHPLTRDDLDPAFPDTPVVVVHVSTHGAVLNSAALKKFGITAATPTPPGGIIARRPGTREPTGLLMETAWISLHEQMPAASQEQEPRQLRYAQDLYAAAGVTTAQDGATMAAQVEVLKRAADRGELFIDIISYPFIGELEKVLQAHPARTFGHYDKRFKLGGCKIMADGSPQGRTAYFTTPYLTGGPGGETDWKGEPTFPRDILDGMFRTCYDRGLQVIAHANGDAAIDIVLGAHAAATAGTAPKDRRTVVIHSQFVRRDQLKQYVDHQLIPSFYTEHTFFFGQAHIKNRGIAQASFISPMKTAIAMGLKPTNHTDFSVAPINQMMVVWSAVNRRLRSGDILGPDERINPLDALKAITIHAAHAYFEEAEKGSIEPGKLADLVILDGNPLTVDPGAIKDIKVVETIKEGRTIYRAAHDRSPGIASPERG